MNIPSRNYTDIVRDMSAAITASAGRIVDMSVGSILRAIVEANAAMVLWVQYLTMLVLQTTRAATSTGSDLDTWMADFTLSRKPAAAAKGSVSFSRYSAAVSAVVTVGTALKTVDGAVSFHVAGDISNSAWQASLNGYLLPAGVSSIDIPIEASLAGASGNVLAHSITVLAASVPGVDTVTNGLPTLGGTNSEIDEAFRKRFQDFFAARSRATLDAISYSIRGVQDGLRFSIQENIDITGNKRPGSILILVEDRRGNFADGLRAAIFAAVDSVRPVGTAIILQPPHAVDIGISLNVTFLRNAVDTPAVLQNRISDALWQYVADCPIGGMVSITRISEIAYRTTALIANISQVTLNGQAQDVTSPANGSFHLTGVTFS